MVFSQGNVTVQVDTAKNPKKAKLNYTIYTGQRYKLDSVTYVGFSPKEDSLIHATYSKRLLIKEDAFTINKLDEERNRLVELFRNNRYYFYRPDFDYVHGRHIDSSRLCQLKSCTET